MIRVVCSSDRIRAEGYSSTKAALEDVTTRKGQINEEKTRTLAEASAMVREVDRQIKASSRDLKPLLMERKQLKAEKVGAPIFFFSFFFFRCFVASLSLIPASKRL